MSALERQQASLAAIALGAQGGEDAFTGPVRASVSVGLGIYRLGYRLRLLECLRNDYPKLLDLAGAAEFERIADAYIDAHPSRHPNIRWWGRDLAQFLGARDEWRARPDFEGSARLEWAEGEAFDAADATPVLAGRLAAIKPESWAALRVAFHPSLRRVDTPDGASWIVWRKDLDVLRRAVEADEAAALDEALSGGDFGAVCGKIADVLGAERAAERAAGLLRVWLDAGLIAAISE